MLDVLIQNGLVVDGSGVPGHTAAVAVEGDRIAEVGRLATQQAETVIDASGCVVAPGFVDMHSHSDFTLPVNPTADSQAYQGITTVVVGMCGGSPVPLLEETREQMIARRATGAYSLPWEKWSTFQSYLEYLTDLGTSVNVVPLVGQGTVRAGVMGFVADRPTAKQMERMQAEAIKAMESGAVGLSTGLIYPPGSYASTEELISLTRPVGQRGGFYFSHIRGESHMLLDALTEAIRIGRETGAAVEIAHLKAAQRSNWDKAPLALELIDRARAEGLDVTADMYPYLAGSTGLVSMLPDWAHEGGKEAILERLRDEAVRREMAEAMRSSSQYRGVKWDEVLISRCPSRPDYEGRYVHELGAEAGISSHTWVFDALLEAELDASMIVFMMTEDNLKLQLRHPAVMIGTDGYGLATEGPLSKGVPHPRNYGTFPRVLGRYVREQRVIPLEEAIWKMTGLPAQKLRLPDRGLVKKGYKADLVVFDPDTVSDRATFERPHQYPVGVHHVVVNGKLVIHRGAHTGARPGSVLGRG